MLRTMYGRDSANESERQLMLNEKARVVVSTGSPYSPPDDLDELQPLDGDRRQHVRRQVG